jgi:hypothetical protein
MWRVKTMVNYVSTIVFVVLMAPGLYLAAALRAAPVRAVVFLAAWTLADALIASSIRLAAEWERAVVFRVGKLSGVKGPGLFLVIPLIDWVRMMDTRVQALMIGPRSCRRSTASVPRPRTPWCWRSRSRSSARCRKPGPS